MFSAVLIVPVALLADANKLGEVLDWGPNNYSVALSANNGSTATHYGLHSWVAQSFVDMLTAAEGGQLPPIPDMTQQQVVAVLSGLIASIRPTSESHWADVLSANGFRVI